MARLFFPAASSPTLPSPGPRACSWSLKPGLEGGERGSLSQAQPRAGRAEAAPPPALRAWWLAITGRRGALPKPAHSPCPISLPRAPELAATSAGPPHRSSDEARRHWSERGSEPETETGGGGQGPCRNFPPTLFRVFGVQLGERKERKLPCREFPFPALGPARGSRTGGEEGRVPALRGLEGRTRAAAEVRRETRRTGPAACSPSG